MLIFYRILFYFFLFFSFYGCIQNTFRCPVDVISLSNDCRQDRREDHEEISLLFVLAMTTKHSGWSGGGNWNNNSNNGSAPSGDEANDLGEISGETQSMENAINNSTYKNCSGSATTKSSLTTAAQYHAYDMANNDIFSHIGSDGLMPNSRVDNQSFSYLTDPLTTWNTSYSSLETSLNSGGNGYAGVDTGDSLGLQNWQGIFEIIAVGEKTASGALEKMRQDPGYQTVLDNYCTLGLDSMGIARNSGTGKDGLSHQWVILFAKNSGN